MRSTVSLPSETRSSELIRLGCVCLAALGLVGIGPLCLGEYSVDILIRSFLFGAVAVTLDILWGYTGILSFGQSAFFAIGAYAGGLIFTHLGLTPLDAILAVGIGLIVASLLGALVGWLAFGYGVSDLYVSVATLVLCVVVVRILYAGGTFTGSSSGLSGFTTFDLSMPVWFALTGSFLVIVAALGWLLVHSDAGTLFVSIRENEQRARYFGLATGRIKIALFAAAAAIAALAGFGYASYTDVVAPDLANFKFGTAIVIWVALGGRATLLGPAIAAVLIDFISAYLSGSLPFIWELLVGVVFIAVIVVMPQGLGPGLARGVRSMLPLRSVAPSSAAQLSIASQPVITAQSDHGPSAIAVTALSRHYGSLRVLDDISFTAQAGELVSLVGPNGAGKTTLIRCISDGTERSGGDVAILGCSIGRLTPEYCARLGLGRKFQTPTVFEALTVAQSLRIARARIDPPSLWRRADTINLPQAALQVVQATGLAEQLANPVRSLSHGGKQALELAMVLAAEPRVLLLDEPTAGLTKAERRLIGGILVDLVARHRLCILLIEHDLDFVRQISSRIIVLHQGRIVLDGDVATVVGSELVRTIYAGEPQAIGAMT
ncbi:MULTISPECIES: branched-chain amino acid ABC transporter ATP-binding protein/permease [Acidiphilium]|uniref:Branched-chain amino acid transport system permease protein n=1 Tax=Acidiphilium rubrum TaxID=526 RepID=A0A8G2FDL0_ACIRU|nr:MULTISPECIES: ATP-binding cassette domain-containing protein [Acidiphilium]SIQ89803.1 branched-chain amino acid transport system permease protein [Acidiphilium rubrum]